MDTQIFMSFVEGAVGLVVGAFVWFFIQWANDIKTSLTNITTAMGKVVDDMSKVAQDNAVKTEQIQQHRKELDRLWRGENCPNPSCSFRIAKEA